MSYLDNFYRSLDKAQECKEKGDILRELIEYWLCIQYDNHNELLLQDKILEEKVYLEYERLRYAFVKMPLSVYTYLRGCQCIKALWLLNHNYNDFLESESLLRHFERRKDILNLAYHLFPNGIDASWMDGIDEVIKTLQDSYPYKVENFPLAYRQSLWLEHTNDAIKSGVSPIYNAAFSSERVFVTTDILKINYDQVIESAIAYEIKSTNEITDEFIQECALKYYIINQNMPLDDMIMIYPDKDYLYQLGKPLREINKFNCDINKLFKTKSILEDIKVHQGNVAKNIKRILPIVSDFQEPVVPMSEHCKKPYKCEFRQYCTFNCINIPLNPVSAARINNRLNNPNKFFSDALKKFEKLDIEGLIKEFNHRVIIGKKGGWSVWGIYREQIDYALILEIWRRRIDMSEVNRDKYIDFSKYVIYNNEKNKLEQL